MNANNFFFLSIPFRFSLHLRLFVALMTALACQNAGAQDDMQPGRMNGPDVTLEEMGDQVTLDNGIVSAVVNKSNARITSLRFNGTDMLDRGGNIYFSMDGGTSFRTPSRCVYSVKMKSADMVDISCKRFWKDEPQAFDIDIHYVLRRGDSGVYVYAVLDHPANYPATGYVEWRMVWRTPTGSDDWIYVDDLRQWQMPAPDDYKTAEKTSIKEIVKLTQGVRAGQFDCK